MDWKRYQEYRYDNDHILASNLKLEEWTEQDLIYMNSYINRQDRQILELIGSEDWDTEYMNYLIDSGYQAEMDPDTYYSNYSYHDDIDYWC